MSRCVRFEDLASGGAAVSLQCLQKKKKDFFHSTDEKPNICILFIRNEDKAGSQPGVVQNMSSLDKLYFSTVDT